MTEQQTNEKIKEFLEKGGEIKKLPPSKKSDIKWKSLIRGVKTEEAA